MKASGWLQNAVTKTDVRCCNVFSLSSVVVHAFSVLCVYLKFGDHPHPTFVPNFVSFAASTAELGCGEQIVYSPIQSFHHSSSLSDAPGTRLDCSCNLKLKANNFSGIFYHHSTTSTPV